MATVGLEGTDVKVHFNRVAARQARRVADSMRAAMNRAREDIHREWQVDVSQAGNFGQRWVDALTTPIEPRTGRTHRLVMTVRMGISYWRIHEYGGTIFGRPLLWIPLPWTGIKIRAREYGRRYGLFRVDRKSGGNPLLLSIRDRKPKYVGVESVTLRKRFHLRRIVRKAGQNLGKYYREEFRRRG